MKKSLTMTAAAGVLFIGLFQSAWAKTETITVLAAASLTNALDAIASEYKQNNAVEINTSYASSSVLARQIEQGAPANLFISADQRWMDYLEDKTLIEDKTRATLLGNDLVLITPVDSELRHVNVNKVTDWTSLLQGHRLAVGDPDHVPAGKYTKDALTFLDVWDELSPQMARADNVRAALLLVERKEAPLGIVYGSDAVASDKVKVVGIFPEDSHLPVEYPMAIVKGHSTPAAQAFYAYLQSPEAAAVFKQFGFSQRVK